MKELTECEAKSVEISGGIMGLLTAIAGGSLGAAIANKTLEGVNISLFGLGIVPVSLTLAGGLIGFQIGGIFYSLEEAIYLATKNHTITIGS